MSQEYANWLPTEMSQGGLLDDVDVTLKGCHFVEYDFEGKSETGPSVCFAFGYVTVEGVESDRLQYYSVGKPETWEITESDKAKREEADPGVEFNKRWAARNEPEESEPVQAGSLTENILGHIEGAA